MPFLPMHLANFNRLPESVDWHWSVAEGAAMSIACTRWCRAQSPRLSKDGTTEFLRTLKGHPRVTVHQRPMWFGKVEMVNTCLQDFTRPGIVLEVDADEIWLPNQLMLLMDLFTAFPEIGSAHFFCRYFVGHNIIITTKDSYGNRPTEWARCWRWTPKLRAISHEPPIMDGLTGTCASREHTQSLGLVFDHLSWVYERQAESKGSFYGYREAVKGWRRLQANKVWPCELNQFLPWVDPGVQANVLWKLNSTAFSDAQATFLPRSRLSNMRSPRVAKPA